jgi:hypothetical protein
LSHRDHWRGDRSEILDDIETVWDSMAKNLLENLPSRNPAHESGSFVKAGDVPPVGTGPKYI